MKRYKYEIIGILEVRWARKGETSNSDFICWRESNTNTKGVGMLLSKKPKKLLLC
jgi:hypothetical protein